MSIRLKITLWFSAALIIVVSITYIAILFVSNQVIQKTIRDELITTVESNVDEVEYYAVLPEIREGEADRFMNYNGGFLEIDDDFLSSVNEVYTALYINDGTMMYGENPIARSTQEMTFADSRIQKIKINGTEYYIFDRKLTGNGLDSLWLRGIVSEHQGAYQMSEISRLSLIIMPAVVFLSILGGYIIAARSLYPIKRIADAASEINKGSDLKKRIELKKGSDELHQLADSFNSMFERLDRSFTAEKQFTSDASHELRTPMSVILARCEYSLENDQDTKDFKNSLAVIQRQGKKMSRLISDMLDYVRLEERLDISPSKEIDLSELVRSVCTDMSYIREKNIDLSFDAPNGITANGDSGLLCRLLENLISNAYRYGRENGHIDVSLSETNSEILLSVSDDGIGIAEEDFKRVFDRFYRADPSRSSSGTGLGLSFVSEIAKIHGGRIELTSKKNVGSCFTLHLPKNKI